MIIKIALTFDERAAVRLLNWLALENVRIFRGYDARQAKGLPGAPLPGLYESGARYQREPEELWSDYLALLQQGHEDCDALAAARAGELMARGWKALHPRDPRDLIKFPGDGGYAEVMRLPVAKRPTSFAAEVLITTRTEEFVPGMYHCIVRYRVGRQWYRDDPSARLGMYDDENAPERDIMDVGSTARREAFAFAGVSR